jgi:hypothetical protein
MSNRLIDAAFAAGNGHYAWLRESVFVCTGAREASRVILDCHALK